MARYRPGLFDVVGVAAVAAMVVALVGLFQRHGSGLGELTLDLSQEELAEGFREGYEFHGVYMGSRKVGALRTERRRLDEGYQMLTELELTVSLMGQRSQTLTRLDAVLDEDFRLSSFDLEMRGGQIAGTMSGSWTGTAMVVEADLNLGTFERTFEMPEAPFILTSLRPMVMRRSLEEGERISITYYDPINMQPVTSDIVYRGRADIEVMGASVNAFHFEEIKLGQSHDVFVNELGEVLVEDMPLGMKAVREPEAEARYGIRSGGGADTGEGDTREAVSVEAASAPRPNAARLQFIVGGGSSLLRRFGEDGRRIAGDRLAVRVARPIELPPAGPLSERLRGIFAAELMSTLGSNVDDPALGTVLGAHRAERERLDQMTVALTEHVHEAIRYDPTASKASGNVALADGVGDALASARALTALLRAARIPARLVHGLLYLPGEEASYARHVWVEVRIKDDWYAVDPVLGTAPADAGRLALARGELERPEILSERIGELEIFAVEEAP